MSLERLRKAVFHPTKSDLEIMIFLYLPLVLILLGFVFPLLSTILSARGWGIFSDKYYLDLSWDAFDNIVEYKTLKNKIIITVRGFDLGVIGNSIMNAILVTLTATLLGTSVAVLVGFYRFRGRRVFAALAYVPLLMAPFVNAYIIQRFVNPTLGYNTLSYIISKFFTEPLLGKTVIISFKNQAGVFLAQVLMFYPIVYINTLAALAAVDATLIEQALNLGARGFRLLRKIVLPLIVPGILAGSTLVFILSLEDVGGPIIFKYHKFISYEVYQSVAYQATQEIAKVASLSLIMLVAALTPLVIARRYLSLRYYARLARGAPRPFYGLRLDKKGYVLAYLVILPVIMAAAIPQFGIIVLAFSERWVGALPDLLPASKLFTNFEALLSIEGIRRSIINSLYYLGQAIVFIAVLGFMAGYATARARLPGATLLDTLTSMPLAIPGLVVAFSYFVFFSNHDFGGFFDPQNVPYGVVHLLVLAYVMRRIPFTVRSVFTSVIQTPEELEEAARSLGSRRLKVLARIVLPLTWRGLIAGMLLSSIYVLAEVSVSVTIGALGGDIYSSEHLGPITFALLQLTTMTTLVGGTQPQAKAAALAVLLMVLETSVIAISSRLARRGQALITV